MAATQERPIGFGRLKRKEDARFIRGQGNYLDDIKLPGMVHGALLRSPYAHARILSIDTVEGARAPERGRRRHRQGPRDARPRLDADDLLRHAGRPGRRQGALPGPGGRVRDRDRPVQRPGRAAADRRRVRAAARRRQRPQGARRGRAADPRRQGRPARQPRQPAVGGRRRGRDGPRLRRGRHHRQPRHHLPALPPGAARDVRDDRRLQPGDRPARPLQRQPGAARPPHGLRARRRPRRAHDPHPVQRHRRRLRQQGAGLPRLRVRDRRLDRRRRPGQVGRGPHRQPRLHRLRARLRHALGDVRQGREDHRPAGRRDRRPRRLRLHRPADQVPGRLLPHRLRLLRPAGLAREGQGRLHQQGAGRRRLPLLVPHHRGRLPRRADGRRAGAGDGGRPDRAAHAQLHRARAVPVRDDHRLDLRLRQLRRDDAGRDGDGRLRGAAARAGGEARARRADGHRRLLLHRGRRRRPAQAHGHPRPGHERRRRPARAPVRQGRRVSLRPDPGPGPRDDVRADRRRGARHPARGRRGPPRRHRPLAVRARHLRQPLDAGVRRRGGRRLAQGARQGARDRGDDARDAARGPRVGEGPLVRQGRPGEGRADRGHRGARLQRRRAARGHGGRARRAGHLRPAEPHLPVRRLHRGRRHRPRHGAGHGPPLHRGRRLRRADQPDDRRGPDPRRPRRGRRHRADGADQRSTRRATA